VTKDPVCGMQVDEKQPGVQKTQYQGQTYWFCGDSCKQQFETNPTKYAMKAGSQTQGGTNR
jgi:YHS domain-containing protein